ncbi:MAG: 50S ribosomal protein L11 methyltransferase [Methyloprofundus sp.]|nr:50S ribosomal protein L11 methyltransferase [Methyloprofundus sp.]
MAWHQVSVVSDAAIADDISDFLSELGAVSVTFMSSDSKPVYEPEIGETKIWEQTKTIALFELEASPEIVQTLLFEKFTAEKVRDWYAEILEDETWERSWMEHFHPMLFAERLWVYPTGQEQDREGTVSLVLDPGLAFGTGTHPTTALCLEWLAANDVQGKTVIDFGCGSGILAVAAILLGAKEAHAIDIDPQALIATQDNALKNKVSKKIKTYLPEEFNSISADIVLANILAKPLIELSASITELVNPQGQLVLSGILSEQADSVSKTYQADFTMDDAVIMGEWCRLEGVKNRLIRTLCPKCSHINTQKISNKQHDKATCSECKHQYNTHTSLDQREDKVKAHFSYASWQEKKLAYRPDRWALGCALALVLLIGQVDYFKGYALSQDSGIRPWLQRLSSLTGYSVAGYHKPLEFSTIGSSLEQPEPGYYQLQASFINHADFRQSLPHLELSLQNIYGTKFSQRTFSPQEYLSKNSRQTSVSPSEALNIDFLIAVPSEEVGGYTIALK